MDDLKEQLKEIYSAYVPVIECPKIEQAFCIGQLCFNYMNEIEKELDYTVEDVDFNQTSFNTTMQERIDICADETGLSRNQVINTTMLYTWCLNNGMIVDNLNFDILYNWWNTKQGGLPTLAKIYRLITPKPAKEDREVKKATLKRQIGKAINEANYIDFKALDGAKMILNVNEAI